MPAAQAWGIAFASNSIPPIEAFDKMSSVSELESPRVSISSVIIGFLVRS